MDARRKTVEASAQAQRAVDASEERADRWRIEGRVLGWEGGPAPLVRVGTLGRQPLPRERELAAAVDAEGRFALEVGALMVQEARDVHCLVVRAAAAGRLPAFVRLYPAAAARVATEDGGRLYRLTAELALAPVATVEGRVLDAAGRPAGEAQVLLVDALSEGSPATVVASCRTGAGGAFQLLSPREGELWLVAVDDEHRPAAARVRTWFGRSLACAPLVLAPGAAVAGRLLPRADGSGPKGELLELTLRSEASLIRSGGFELRFDGVGFEHARRRARADERGAFRFLGAAPAAHRLSALGREGGCSVRGAAGAPLDVRAPATDLAVSLAQARIEVRVAGPDGPVARARVRVELDDWLVCAAGADGRLSLSIPPSVRGALWIEAPGLESRRVPFVGPGRGEALVQDIRLRAGPTR
ncbi:MAG: carboxypeptidase-like regulatory domain-containing protein [Planctomycetota bacterium]